MKSRDRIQDELLVLKCQTGDTKAFEELVDRWQERLWRHAYQLMGEEDAAWDAVQETWIAVIKGMRRLQDAAAFPRWAYRILSNRCTDWIRERQKQRNLTGRLAADANGREEAPANAHDSLRAALACLPGERRALLSLRYGEGYSTAEMADILGIPEGTVKSRLHHAREQLRQIMERHSHE